MATNLWFTEVITSLNSDNRPQYEEGIREIFFKTSHRKTFKTDNDKEVFYQTWTSYYFKDPNSKIIIKLDENNKVKAYLMYTTDSLSACDHFESINPSYPLFKDLYTDYPAHLHINTHPDTQGLGYGSELINSMIASLSDINGVHLITHPTAQNVGFYKKNLFTDSIERKLNGHVYLFLGRRL